MLGSTEMSGGSEDQPDVHPVVRGLRTICRCNNIKYRTIERAILRGARTLHQVAACTTATTGHCGGSCTPEVQEMLADLCGPCPTALAEGGGAADAWWLRKK